MLLLILIICLPLPNPDLDSVLTPTHFFMVATIALLLIGLSYYFCCFRHHHQTSREKNGESNDSTESDNIMFYVAKRDMAKELEMERNRRKQAKKLKEIEPSSTKTT